MRVWVERTPWRIDGIDIRIGDRAGKYIRYAAGVNEDGSIRWETTDENVEIPVFLRLSPEVFEDIAKELGGYVPSTDVTTEALKDARAVRDRLLTLVEEGWSA